MSARLSQRLRTVSAICIIAASSATPGASQTPSASAPAASPPLPIDYDTVRLERLVEAVRTTEDIVLDGRLDEDSWARAQPATDFIQWQPRTGAPATEATEVRFLYDDENLYIGALCHDSNLSRMVLTDLKEDFATFENDALGVFIDSLHDQRSGFTFMTNPGGAKFDSQAAHDGDQINTDWDGVWDVRTAMTETGWAAEIVIPFKTLRFSSGAHEFGLNLLRRLRRNNEDSMWAPIPRRYRSFVRPSMAGMLRGLTGIQPGRNLKIKPFAVASATETRGGLRQDVDRTLDGGVDVKYGVTPSLTLDVTYRTDFSQVEVDQQQVNLTRFNLFFPEKREFFLENSGLFRVAGNRGGNSAGSSNFIPFFSRRIGLSRTGTPIPIVGGTRVSGRLGQYDVGVLAMRVDEDRSEPANNFLVGRLTRNFRDNSWIGAIVTHRDSTRPGDVNRLYGVDLNLRFFTRLELASFLMRTETPGRDGRDAARMFEAAWRDNDLTLEARYEELENNFNPEVGFVRREDFEHYSASASWLPRVGWTPAIRNLVFSAEMDYYADSHGRLETREQVLTAGVALNNGGAVTLRWLPTFDRLRSAFAIRRDLAIAPGDYEYDRWSAAFNSDRSRMLSGTVSIESGEFWNGHSSEVTAGADFKPNAHLTLGATLRHNMIDLPARSFSTTLVGSRVQFAFTSTMFLNSFLQYNADTRQFTTNTRFNIIHRPLSDVYLVYDDQRNTVTGALLARAFILKITNLLDF